MIPVPVGQVGSTKSVVVNERGKLFKMTFKYLNFKKQPYFIHQKLLKSGKVSYTCKKDHKGALSEIPKGYEIYENPNGQVFCRKIQEKIIADKEIKMVKAALKKYCDLIHVKVDVKKNIISIWDANGILPGLYSNYQSSLRFVLVDKQKRLFNAERFCYLGRIDDWITLYDFTESSLDEVMKETLPHLGKDSFFELM